MRKEFLWVIAVLLAFAVAGYAQSSSASSQSSPDQSASSSSAQSGSQDNSMQSGSPAATADRAGRQKNSLEGCIVRQETDYFIQPVSGSRVRLNGGDQDLSQYVGQDVRLSGRWNPYENNNANNHQATTQPSGAPITGDTSSAEPSNNGQQLFLVTRVDKVSDTCPTGTPGNSSNPQ